MEVEKAKRKRGRNFSEQEELVLMKLVEDQRHIYENKRSDAATWKQKEQAWKRLAEVFSARTGLSREWKTLRDKFDNLKRKSRRKKSTEKPEVHHTNDGCNRKGNMSSSTEKVAAFLSDTATWLENTFDGGACRANTPEEDSQNKRFDTEKLDQEILPFENAHQSKKMSYGKLLLEQSKRQKRRLVDEQIRLTLLQQTFYEGENRRAEEKHQQELIALKLKNELLQLQVQEVKVKVELSLSSSKK